MSLRKNPDERRAPHLVTYDDLPICWDGKIRGPELPEDYVWCDMTKQWWQMVRKSAQAMAFLETDWAMMLETAMLHNRFWGGQKLKGGDKGPSGRVSESVALAGEIRRRLEPYGFTWADRRKYGISVSTPESIANEATAVTRKAVDRESAVDYRRRLNGLTPS